MSQKAFEPGRSLRWFEKAASDTLARIHEEATEARRAEREECWRILQEVRKRQDLLEAQHRQVVAEVEGLREMWTEYLAGNGGD